MPHDFTSKLGKIMNSGKSRSVILWGNVNDLFYNGQSFVPLVEFLSLRYTIAPEEGKTRGITQLILETNQAVRIVGDIVELRTMWNGHYGVKPQEIKSIRQSTGFGLRESLKVVETDADLHDFDKLLAETSDSLTMALEFLRRVTMLSQQYKLKSNLLVMIEGFQFILPENNLAQMNEADRKRLAILIDWFSDPKFSNGHDSVILISESKSLIHSEIVRMPQVASLQIPSPNIEERELFAMTLGKQPVWAKQCAGLTLHAYRQILLDDNPSLDSVVQAVESFMVGMLGEGVVEFKRPQHSLDDVLGYRTLKKLFRESYIPRLQSSGKASLPGLTFAGPIGGGKTFIGTAVCSDLGIPVVILKNFRSMYFGQTDVIFERIRALLLALVADGGQIGVFVDEADTAVPNVGPEQHETERRMGGKFLQLMGDSYLRGKVIWFLMTARIHNLAPDVRREGRPGEIIIPILDPFEPNDRKEFFDKAIGDLGFNLSHNELDELLKKTEGYSPAQYDALKSELAAHQLLRIRTIEHPFGLLKGILDDMMPGDIGRTRRYQTLQALLNCKRKSLIPDQFPGTREDWESEARKLEAEGIR